MSTVASDAALADACITVLKRTETELSCIALARLCHADSSHVFRILSGHPDIVTKRGVGYTTFAVRK